MEFIEYNNKQNISNEVLNGNAQYGLTYSSIIAEYLNGKDVVLIANFFKQSSLVLVAQEDINTPADLKGKKVMGVSNTIDNTTLLIMLNKFDISIDDIQNIPESFNIDDFINKKIDAMSVFTTNELYYLNKKNIKYKLFDPTVYGAKYYDVNLFTTKNEAINNPLRVENFRDASIKGWEYALKHQDEIVELILKKYNTQKKSKDALLFEATQIEQLMMPNIYKIGSIDKFRIKTIADNFIGSKFVKDIKNRELNDFTFRNKTTSITFSKKELEFIKKHPVLKVGNDKFWPPFDFYENNQAKGFSIDYLKEIGALSGLKFEFVQAKNWEILVDKLKNKKIDILTAFQPNLNNKKIALFSDNILVTFESMITRNNHPNLYSYKDLYNKRVGIVKGYDFEDEIKQNHKQINMILFDTPIEALQALSDKEIDVFIENSSVALYLIHKYFLTNLKLNGAPKFPNLPNGDIIKITSRIDYPELHSIIQKAIKLLPYQKKQELKRKWVTIVDDYIKEKQIILTPKEQQYLKSKQQIKMCVDPDWMPLEKIENGKYIGLGADYMKLFSDKINTPIILVPTTTWTQSLQKAQNRECDILSIAAKTPDREKYMDFCSAHITTPIVIATKVGIPFIDNLKQILDKKLGVVRNYSFYENLKLQYPYINLIEVDSVQDGLEKVERGQIFGYIDSSVVINNIIQNSYIGTIAISGKIQNKLQLHLATRNDEPLLHDIFQKAVKSINSEQRQKILNKWIAISYTKKTDYTLIWQLSIIALIIILGIFYWNRKLYVLNKQLKIEKKKAQEATELKSEFLANMSHEIRTPMNGIIGMAYLALSSNLDNKQKDYIQKIDSNAKRLLRIINDILDFSKIEAGKLIIEKRSFDLHKMIEDMINSIELSADKKNLKIIVKFDSSIVTNLFGDELRIGQVLANLYSNAIKFTPHGEIGIYVKKFPHNRLRIEVRDSGIGLTDEEQSKIFNSFSQADGKTTREYGGTGLGLSISKQLVELMNGKLWVESTKDKGSSFIFDIELIETNETNDINVKKSTSYNNKNLKDSVNSLNGSKILLVEDNKTNQEIILGLLEDSDISIDIANNAKEGIEKFKINKYELIFMDIQMPIMDGYEATKIIREMDKHIPIIALTANAMNKDVKKTKNAGMNEHLNKPIEIEKFYETLLKYISKKTLNLKTQGYDDDDLKIPEFINIDSIIGLSNLGENKKLYLKILNNFYTDNKDLDIETLDDTTLQILTHTIKGVSANIGALNLNKIAKELESTLDTKLIAKFQDELNKVLNELSKIKVVQKKPFTPTLKLSTTKRDELFLALKNAIATNRPHKYNPILQKIEKYNFNDNDKAIIEKIKDFIDKYKFKKAIEIL